MPVQGAKPLKQAHEEAEILIIENMNHVLRNASLDPIENIGTYSNPDAPLAGGSYNELQNF